MRLAITGAQGTGKSIFGRALHAWMCRRIDPAAVYLTGLQETVLASLRAAEQRPPATVVRAFICAHIERERRIGMRLSLLDRCLLDAAAYARVLDCLPVGEQASLREAIDHSVAGFSAIFVMPITTDYPAISAADETPEFRRQIQAAILDIGRTAAAPMVLLSGTAIADEARAREAVERLWTERTGDV